MIEVRYEVASGIVEIREDGSAVVVVPTRLSRYLRDPIALALESAKRKPDVWIAVVTK